MNQRNTSSRWPDAPRVRAECPDDGSRYLLNPGTETWTCESPHPEEDGWKVLHLRDLVLDDGEFPESGYDGDGACVLWIVTPSADDLERAGLDPTLRDSTDGIRALMEPDPWKQGDAAPSPDEAVIAQQVADWQYGGPLVPGQSSSRPPGRSYAIGLPVIVTVSDDGFIQVEVDLAEASREVRRYDDGTEGSEEQRHRDSELVSVWVESHDVRNEDYVPATITAQVKPSHVCADNAVPYVSDGPLGHGWECGICGAFLQAG